jgi:6-phosphogluconolactonase/glucosamine-6-phosphate isomerase/deaminase
MKEATLKALEESLYFFNSNKKYSICMTGGKFGQSFVNFFNARKLIILNKNFYLTDERLVSSIEEKNCFLIWEKMKNYEKENFFHNFDYNKSIIDIDTKEKVSKISHHDLCFLSLGEDGHLAGHFKNSLNLNDKICFTEKASKKPFKRISFRVDWLLKSKKIIMVALGLEKQKALTEILNGEGFHSEIFKTCSSELVIITDLKI